MREIKAPARPLNVGDKPKIFLAGSIDMGDATDWQKELTDHLKDTDVVIFNPRRDDWDSTWVQDISFQPFREQVEWELDHMESADIIVYVFDPKGKAPITLMELGLHARRTDNQLHVVCCPEGFWRRGNVQIVCNYYDIPMVEDTRGVANKVIQYIDYLRRGSNVPSQ